MKSSFDYRTHVAEAGLIWSILQTKGATTYSRPIGANGPSVALKAFELDLSEQQSPTHPARPGVPPDATRPCSTPCDRRLLRRRGRYPRHQRASSDYSKPPFRRAVPMTPAVKRVRMSIASPIMQPSPIGRRVSIRIEACSGFHSRYGPPVWSVALR